ncbi:uncharacterized protein DUF2029 [Branchiibius hedensis]|uniref:Uncharacterized protein n=1 Tax=Branchiibius hedensis TaxID=672460 RepID=A0A2Y8ZWV5_9MICO|nr:glycosyltransferase 87 family protein [Branchiibius hedensis]PWJ26967.1 uncharacterized protein DUF2029 [Branchiibius hedensis]SSA35778.1 Protein of unknown function [Branchiibius hedensis]
MSVIEEGAQDPDGPGGQVSDEADQERGVRERAARERFERARVRTPSRVEGPAIVGSQVFGGAVGRFATIGRRGWPFVAALLSAAASVMVALSVLQKSHCVKVGWGSPGSLWRACYSDIPISGGGSGGPWASGGPGQSQPVLTAVLTWFAQKIVPGGSSLERQQMLFAVGAVIVVICIALTVTATAATLRNTPWLAAHVALSPVLITASMVSFDVFGVALAALGLWAWARHRPLLAGVLLGAAVMARSYPLVFVAVLVLLCLRDGRRHDLTRLVAGVMGVSAICIGLAAAVGGEPFAPYAGWNDAGPGYGSVWLLLQIAGVNIPAHPLTVIALAGWVIALLVGFIAVRVRPDVAFAPLALLMLVVVLLTGKAIPVQACLWLLPLLALCAVRWRDHLIWAGVEIVYFIMVWMYIAAPSNAPKGLPGAAYAVFSLARTLAYVGIAWAAWDSSASARTAIGGDPVHRPVPARSATLVALPVGD